MYPLAKKNVTLRLQKKKIFYWNFKLLPEFHNLVEQLKTLAEVSPTLLTIFHFRP